MLLLQGVLYLVRYIMLGHEVIHVMKKKRSGGNGFVATKLDMSNGLEGRYLW